MANSYDPSSDVFDIDTTTDLGGLYSLKGAYPATPDKVFIHNAAQLTNSYTIEVAEMRVGYLVNGTADSGTLQLPSGAILELDNAVSTDGLYVSQDGVVNMAGVAGAVSEIRVRSGGSGSPKLQEMLGQMLLTYCRVTDLDLCCPISGVLELTDTTFGVDLSGTESILLTGALTMVRSEITEKSGNRWALLNFGASSTMDAYSVLNNARLAIVYDSSETLIFDDDPDGLTEDDTPVTAKGVPAGGDKTRGKTLGFPGRRLLVVGAFKTDPGGTNRWRTHFAKLRAFIQGQKTISMTWDEGIMSRAMFDKAPFRRGTDTIYERPYAFEVQEIY